MRRLLQTLPKVATSKNECEMLTRRKVNGNFTPNIRKYIIRYIVEYLDWEEKQIRKNNNNLSKSGNK